MDLFYEALPFTQKRRTHFHRFMLDIHRRRRDYTDTVDPLLPIARDIASEVRVLCFDEFFVSDIGDAMILGRLLDALFAHGVCLVATSNLTPTSSTATGCSANASCRPSISSRPMSTC